MKPLIRKDGVPKVVDDDIDPAQSARPTSARRAGRRRSTSPPRACARSAIATARRALAGFGSAKGSNEEAYLFQKLVRTGFGSNNVDHCTRLCHASSVAALLENIGSGAVTAPFTAVKDADVIIVIGANPTENHPVAATYFKQAAKRGKTLIVMDPRGQALKRHATHMLQFKPGTDVSLLNAIMHVIVEEGLYDRQYIQAHTEGFEKLREHLEGVPAGGHGARSAASTPRPCARSRAPTPRPQRAIIFWGMGISQHVHGTDNARCLISLALMTGQVGRPGTGLHPLRGQNNVQGASDAGLIPMMFPDYGRVDQGRDPRALRGALGHEARSRAGPDRGRDRGRDPRRRDPRHVHHGREPGDVRPGRASRPRGAGQARASGGAGPVPDRDRDVRRRGAAGLGLAGEGRHGHQHQPPGADGPRRRCRCRATPARTGGSSRRSRAASGSTGATSGPREVYAEMARAMPSLDNITWERLERESSVTYPVRRARTQPGHDIVFGDRFPTDDGRGQLHAGRDRAAGRAAGRDCTRWC